MYWSPTRWYKRSLQVLLVCFAVATCFGTAMSQAQSSAADLQGTVRDANGAVVANASVTVRNTGTASASVTLRFVKPDGTNALASSPGYTIPAGGPSSSTSPRSAG